MNIYALVGLGILVLVVAHGLNLVPAVQQLANNLAAIPQLDPAATNRPALYSLAIHMMWLIAIIGVIRVVTRGKRDDE